MLKSRFCISLALVVQMVVQPLAFAHVDRPVPPPAGPVINTADVQKPFEEFSRKLESGQPIEATDPFHASGQWVEIVEDGKVVLVYRLDQVAIERPKIGFTSMRAYYDKDKDALVLEAQKGANDEGKYGKVVARQFIPMSTVGHKIQPAAIVQDEEMLTIFGNDGKTHVINWHRVLGQAFRCWIPVFTDLSVPLTPQDFSGQTVKIEYATAGTRPPLETDLIPGAMVRRNASGQLLAPDAGDLVVMAQASPSDRPKLVGIFDRSISHAFVARKSRLLDMFAEFLQEKPRYISTIAESLRSEEAEHEDFMNELTVLENSASAHPIIAAAIRSIGPEQLAGFKNDIEVHNNLAKRQRDKLGTFADWQRDYEEIRAKTVASYEKAQAKLKPEERTPLTAEKVTKQWQASLDAYHEWPKENDERISGYLWIAIATTAYMASPMLLEMGDMHQKVAAFNWIHQNLYPAVLKDAVYRWPTLLMSTISLAALWPAGVFASWFTGKTFQGLSAWVQSKDTWLGRTIRDFTAGWKDLGTWQRITTLSCRTYAELTLAAWITAIERIGRQATYFTAKNNGLNPYQRITPESAIGQRVGITQPMRLGFINPFLSKTERAGEISLKTALMGEVKAEKERLESHAFLLAGMVIAEKYNIDIGTILTLEASGKTPTLSMLQEIFENPKAREEWEILTEDLHGQISVLPFQLDHGDAPKVDAAELQKQYQLAKDIAEKVIKLDPKGKFSKKLWRISKLKGLELKQWLLNLGRNEYNSLKIITTNKWVSNQVRLEFISDHLIGIYYMALFGGRADLAHPTKLAASADGPLWTTPAHLTDVGTNAQIHGLFQGGRMALMFQAIKAKVESIYNPREDKIYQSNYQREGIVPAMKKVGESLKFWNGKLNFGGLAVRSWKNYIATVQATIALQFAMRATIGQQGVTDALFASTGFFLNSIWWFFWPAFFFQGMSITYNEELGADNSRLVKAKRLLGFSIRETDPVQKAQYLQQGVDEMRALYQDRNPQKLAEFDQMVEGLTADATEQVESVLKQIADKPPVQPAPNYFINDFSIPALIAATTTYLGISLSIFLYDKANLNAAMLMHSALWSAGWTAVAYLALGANPWHVYRNASTYWEKFKSNFREKPTCEGDLNDGGPK